MLAICPAQGPRGLVAAETKLETPKSAWWRATRTHECLSERAVVLAAGHDLQTMAAPLWPQEAMCGGGPRANALPPSRECCRRDAMTRWSRASGIACCRSSSRAKAAAEARWLSLLGA